MTRLALVDLKTNEVIKVLPNDSPRWLKLPDGAHVSPPVAGWEGRGFGILAVEDAVTPEGKRKVSEQVIYDGETARARGVFEDVPPIVKRTRREKLEDMLSLHGLTLEDLKAELA